MVKEKRTKLIRLEVYVDPVLAKLVVNGAARNERTVSNYISRILGSCPEVEYERVEYERQWRGRLHAERELSREKRVGK
jgi:hypothetical protein